MSTSSYFEAQFRVQCRERVPPLQVHINQSQNKPKSMKGVTSFFLTQCCILLSLHVHLFQKIPKRCIRGLFTQHSLSEHEQLSIPHHNSSKHRIYLGCIKILLIRKQLIKKKPMSKKRHTARSCPGNILSTSPEFKKRKWETEPYLEEQHLKSFKILRNYP